MSTRNHSTKLECREDIAAANDLACQVAAEGSLSRAGRLMESVVESSIAVLGDESEDTLSAKNNLATIYAEEGKLKKATAILKRLMKISDIVHQDVRYVMEANLVWVLKARKKLAHAALGHIEDSVVVDQDWVEEAISVLKAVVKSLESDETNFDFRSLEVARDRLMTYKLWRRRLSHLPTHG